MYLESVGMKMKPQYQIWRSAGVPDQSAVRNEEKPTLFIKIGDTMHNILLFKMCVLSDTHLVYWIFSRSSQLFSLKK